MVGGLIKRPPTNHISELTTFADASIDLSSAFTHYVTRDSTEEFIVSVVPTSGSVLVNDLSGDAKEVKTDLGTSDYLQSATPSTSLRAITIADVTFLLNTDKVATMKTEVDDLSVYSRGLTTQPYEGLIWVKSSGQGVGFKAKVKGSGVE